VCVAVEPRAEAPAYPDEDDGTGVRGGRRKLRTKCHDRTATVPISRLVGPRRVVSDHVFIP
jgi:hypothetical protein